MTLDGAPGEAPEFKDVSYTDCQPTLFSGSTPCGEVAEWLKAAVLKTVEVERLPGVRIPSSPPVPNHPQQSLEQRSEPLPSVPWWRESTQADARTSQNQPDSRNGGGA